MKNTAAQSTPLSSITADQFEAVTAALDAARKAEALKKLTNQLESLERQVADIKRSLEWNAKTEGAIHCSDMKNALSTLTSMVETAAQAEETGKFSMFVALREAGLIVSGE